MKIAFLGLGKMGTAIARILLRKGHPLTVWNRTEKATEPLVALGAKSADSPAAAVRGAEAVFTMVHDDPALEGILFDQGALAAIDKGAIHLSLSTISVALAQKLEREHAARAQMLIGSPVFGRPAVAEEGRLWLAVAGTSVAIDRCKPLLEAFSRGITVVGEKPSQAHALKLGGNFMITAMIAALSESFTYAEGCELDPALFLETINNALFQSPFYANYGNVMLHPPESAAATVNLGAKDTRLFQEAAESTGTPTPLANSFQRHLQAAIANGLADRDWAAGYLQQAQTEKRNYSKGLGSE